MAIASKKVRIAAVGDIHCTKTSQGQLKPLFEQMSKHADIILLCGDLTDYGLPEEAQVLAKELQAATVPIVVVFGNHDYESGHESDIKQILTDAGVTVLDGDGCEIEGVGFAGVKGFAGGFGRKGLSSHGEQAIKRFVQEAVEEVQKLETALARLKTSTRVVLLHYAPLASTIEGEPLEIFPFLGSSRLEDPLNRYGVIAAFHGHAHAGNPEGRTSENIPVYNVSLPLMRETKPNNLPFRLIEVSC
ncbi:MAG: metallophosphoesterase family protein [Halothece sp.]